MDCQIRQVSIYGQSTSRALMLIQALREREIKPYLGTYVSSFLVLQSCKSCPLSLEPHAPLHVKLDGGMHTFTVCLAAVDIAVFG